MWVPKGPQSPIVVRVAAAEDHHDELKGRVDESSTRMLRKRDDIGMHSLKWSQEHWVIIEL